MSEQELILLVRQNEELYNTHHPNYKNQPRKDAIWEEIGKTMNQPSYDCILRWIRIRDNFRKAIKLRKQKIDSNMKPPKHENILNFLIPHFSELNDVSKSELHTEQIWTDDNNDNDSIEWKYEIIDTDSGDNYSTNNIKRERSTSPEGNFNSKRSKNVNNFDDNNIISFFMTMAKTVKRFPPALQIQVKRNIFNVVTDIEAELVDKPFYYRKVTNNTDPLNLNTEQSS